MSELNLQQSTDIQQVGERWFSGQITDTYAKLLIYVISCDPDILEAAFRVMQLPDVSQGEYYKEV